MLIQPTLRKAIDRGAPVVALETALLSLGLPYPTNVEVFQEMEAAVRAAGAVPAGIALHEGRVHVGLDASLVGIMARAPGAKRQRSGREPVPAGAQLEVRGAAPAREVRKCARRDIGWILAGGHTGATTVSSTLWLAHRAGIRVFATGGIGGVHPGGTLAGGPAGSSSGGHGPPDISADLATMAEVPMILVSAGTKSICDPVATAELLEALSVPVLGLGTDRFPHFYAGPSAAVVPRIESAREAALAFFAHVAHGGTSTLLVGNPAPADHRLSPALLDRLTAAGTAAAAMKNVSGNALTPFLLDYLARKSRGRTVTANRALLVDNARVAGQIAAEAAAITSRRSRASGTSRASPSRRRR